MMKTPFAAFALSVLTALPLQAGDSFETPVTGEILHGWVQADGTRVAALHLRLAPGWKTYWRAPGDAGIPPQFDWSGSDNLRGVGITWPTPEVFLTAGMRTIGYTGDLVLPLSFAPRSAGAPISINARLDMGVCSDICVPHSMTLKAVINDNNQTPTPAIAAALAERPYSAKEAGVTASKCTLRPTDEGLEIEAHLTLPSTGGTETVVIEPGQAGLWMSETKATRRGNSLVAVGEMITSDGQPLALDRSQITITVLGSKHAVNIQGCKPG
ncbi:DsbC domain containing protein [Sulfitobacter noctilucicola]|nr:DsbC domain containing protein [Sulfitobacter noctilucicola]